MAPTILLADDSPHARRMGSIYLEDLGYQVVAVDNGEAALEALEAMQRQAQTPTLILADAKLPGVSGLELCRRVKARAEWRTIPVLVLVGALATPDAAEQAMADGVLRKPLSSAGLQRYLQKTPEEMLVLAVNEAALGGAPTPERGRPGSPLGDNS